MNSGLSLRCVRLLFFWLQVLLLGYVAQPGILYAATTIPGDIAPHGNPDGKLDSGDLLLMMMFLHGMVVPTAEERNSCDVAPEDAPDGELDLGDFLVLERAALGLTTLVPGVRQVPPLIWGAASPVDRNPYLVSGLADPDAIVKMYINGAYRGSTVANSNGLFDLEVQLDTGRSQIITATSVQGATESEPSGPLTVFLLVRPAPPDLGRISITYGTTTTTIYGQSGSVVADATVIVRLVDGTQLHTFANSDGGFNLILDRAEAVASISADAADGLFSEPAVVTSPGSIAGTFRVNESGAATYSIPISLPSGTAGMAPALTLNYNSNGGNGFLGRGWLLGGLSAITRCPQTIAQDGQPGGVNLDDNDRYCLDGKKLIAINGGVYGANLTEYRTEVDSFARVISYTTTGASPDYFRAWTRSGQVIEFGGTPDSRFNPDSGSDALRWTVNRVQDMAGNYYTVTYQEDLQNNEQYPLRIDYTANDKAGLVPYNSIDFMYTYRSDISSGYVGGHKLVAMVRISNVLVRAGTEVVRDYRFAYNASPTNGMSRLESITECDSGLQSAVCMPSTHFEWRNGALAFGDEADSGIPTANSSYARQLDINGDGRMDLMIPVGTQWEVYFSNGTGFEPGFAYAQSNSGYQNALPIDYNGDGLGDLLVPSGDTGTWIVFESDGNTFSRIDTGIPRNGYSSHLRIMDVNGDGRADLVYEKNDILAIRFLTNDGFSDETVTTVDTGFPVVGGLVIECNAGPIVIDYNDDGKSDLLLCNTGVTADSTTRLVRSTGTNFQLTETGQTYPEITKDTTVLDVNGDGLLDVTYGSNLTLNQRSSFTAPVATVLPACTEQQSHTTDLNADGRADLIRPAGSDWGMFISNGGAFTQLLTTVPVESADDTKLMDINGDGLPDFLIPSGTTWKIRLNSGTVGDRLTGIVNGTGVRTTITYQPITSGSPLYDKYPSGLAADFPEQSFQQPYYVVSEATIDDGVGGQYTTSYHYAGAKIHLQGRGFLGFREVSSTDEQTGIMTKTTYRQDFPYTGLPEEVDTSLYGLLLSKAQNTYSEPANSNGATGVHFPSLSQSIETSYDLPDNGNQGVLLKTVNTILSVDDYGNPLTIDVTTTDAWGNTFRKLTTNTYDSPDLNTWVLDRVKRTTVLHQAPNTPDIIKTSAFSYYPVGDPHQFLLQDEIIEPDAGEGSPLYQKTTHEYDAFGNATRVTTTGRSGYDASSPLQSRTTETVYDSQGRFPAQTTNALGQSEAYTYDDRFGTKTSLTGPNGLSTTWTYDSFGRKVEEQRADGTGTTWRYEFCASTDCPQGGFIETVEASGSAPVINYYDALQRVTRTVTVSMSGKTIYQDTTYDNRGNIANKTRPRYAIGPVSASQVRTGFQYDVLNRPIREAAPDGDGGVVTYTYSNLTRNTHRWNPNGDYDQYDTRVTDGMDQLILVIDARNGSQSYQYDAMGDMIRTTDSAGNPVQTTYDRRGRKSAMDDPDMGHWEYRYNAFGELVWQQDARGQVVTMAYDKLGRMVSRSEPEGATTLRYDTAAHGVGKLASVSYSADGYRRTLTYDPLGRLASETSAIDGKNLTMAYGYDGFSRPQTVTYPSGFIVRNLYNTNGFLTGVRDAANDTSYWRADEDDAEGRVTMETLGNGLQTIRTYDTANDSLVTISTGVGNNATVQNLSYTFDGVGNLKTRTDSRQGLAESFQYDELNRLQTAAIAGVGSHSYVYDALGNIRSKSDYAGHYSYGANGAGPHAVTEVKNGSTVLTSYTYDANGNMTGGDNRTITWTSFNKAAQITKGTASVSFAYDADHNRVKQVHGDTATYYLHPSLHEGVNYEEETTGTLTEYRHYIHAGGRAIAVYTKRSDGTQQTRYLHTDHLGSIDAITDESEAVVERMSFSPFGSRRNTDWSDPTSVLSGFETHHGFTGQEQLDDVGLIHMNGRLYDPKLGRFLSPDIQIQYPDQTQSFNRYTYVNNNPVSLTDPTGYGFFSSLWKSIKSVFRNPKALFALAAGFLTGFATWAALGYGGGFIWGGTAMIAGISAAAGSFVTTLIITNGNLAAALKAGLISGFTAFVGVQIKQGIKDYLTAKGTLYNVERSKTGITITTANVQSVKDRLFVNGIMNDLDRAVTLGLKQFHNQSFALYYNPSHGFIADLTESALGKLFGGSSLSRGLADILQKNPNLFVIAHSQGGIIATNAIEHLSGMNLGNLRVTLNGSAVAERVARAALEGVGSNHLVVNSYPFDLVSNVVALDTLNPVRIFGSIIFSPFLFTTDSPHAAYY